MSIKSEFLSDFLQNFVIFKRFAKMFVRFVTLGFVDPELAAPRISSV